MYAKPALPITGGSVAAGSTLAFTGFHTALVVLVALALIVIGAVLVRITYLGRLHDRACRP